MKKPRQGTRLDLVYLHGGEVVTRPGETLGPRTLMDYELVYIIEGQVVYLSDDVTYVVPPGGFIFGRPGFRETYRWDPQIPTRHAFFHFGINRYPSDWPDLPEWPRVRTSLNSVCASLFRHILQHIYRHTDWPDVRPGLSECRLVEVLIDALIENDRTENLSFDRERPEAVRRALVLMRKMVEEDPMCSLTLTDLAKQAGVTEKHLCRLFARSTGHSPVQTLTLLKLQSSRPLLMRTNLSIKEIAERCGFENPLYFSRCFSKTYSCSSSSYREQLRSGKTIALPNLLPVDLATRARW